MTKKLQISEDLALPLDAITQTFGILALRVAGKSNVGAVMAEEMYDAGLPFVAIDPVGSWPGLRSSADGKGPGLAIPIFGGRYGDVPLEKSGGALIADTVVVDRLSCVLDVSQFSLGERMTFLTDFAERLYRTNRDPLHLFLEEADDYVPQKPMREQARCLRAFEDIVRRGRARGLGMTMITQRSAAINKNVLTQIETLIVLRMTAPQDRAAVEKWVEYHGQADELLESLAELKSGNGWVWSPSWLGVMQRVYFRRRRTFDSGATPKSITGSRPPMTLADVDLEAVRVKMAATIERAKETDPREWKKERAALKARIADLEKKLASSPATKIETKTVEKPILKDSQLDRLEKFAHQGLTIAATIAKACSEIDASLLRVTAKLETAPTARRESAPSSSTSSRHLSVVRPRASSAPTDANVGKGGLQRILIALAQRPQGLTSKQIGVRAGLSSQSGTFSTYISKARANGWVEGSGTLYITQDGLDALGDFEPLPSGQQLLEHWLRELGQSGASRMLRTLADVYPRTMTNAELGEAAGVSSSSGTFSTYLSKLRALELISGRGELRASEEFFE